MFDNRRPLAYFFCLLLLLTGSVSTEAQRKRKTLTPVIAAMPIPKPVGRVHFRVTIDADKALSLSSVSIGFEERGLNISTLQKSLREKLKLQQKPGRAAVEPSVHVTVDPSIDVSTLAGVVRSLRITKNTVVMVDLPDGLMLHILTLAESKAPDVVKPDPLFLVVNFDKDGSLSLNNEPQGSFSDLALLQNTLKDIFKAREVNGVFRLQSNEIEKTVWIKVHPGKTIVDLQKVAAGIELAGSDRVVLQIDDSSRPVEIEINGN